MSLINDALKKAQKQRTGDSTPLANLPSVGGEPAAKIAKRGKPVGYNSQLKRLAAGAAGVMLVALVGSYFAARHFSRPPDAVSAPMDAPPAATAVATSPDPAKPPITFSLPVAPKAAATEPAPAVVAPITTLAGSATPLPQPAPSRPPVAIPQRSADRTQPEPEALPVKLDTKAVVFIENLRIAGIRASATDSKVLMNDRVYRTGDIVEHQLGLKLTGITANSLTFEDERGGRYTRNF